MRLSASNDWLNVSAAACKLGCSEPTVRRLISTGKLPATKVGHAYRVLRRNLEAFEDSCRVRPQRTTSPKLTPAQVHELGWRGEMQLRAFRELGILREREATIHPDALFPDFPEGFELWPGGVRRRWIEELHALYFPKVA